MRNRRHGRTAEMEQNERKQNHENLNCNSIANIDQIILQGFKEMQLVGVKGKLTRRKKRHSLAVVFCFQRFKLNEGLPQLVCSLF